MKKLLLSVLICLLSINLLAQKNTSSQSINSFSFKLFELVNDEQKNCFFSPYSVFGALSMTAAGAKKATQLEMQNALEIEKEINAPEQFKNLSDGFKSDRNIKLLTANSIWLHKSLKIKKSFAKLTSNYYDAKCENVDFEDAAKREKARKEINGWVEKQTNKMIKNFIKPGVLTDATGMVLLNAVYFKALWQTAFTKEQTVPDKFLAASGKKITCEMMNSSINTKYYEDDKFQAVEIPYKNKEASMLIILPKKDTESKINEIDYEYYSDIAKSFAAKKVKVSIPKFKMEVQYELRDAMKRMGMKSAFSKDADFSGITGGKGLTISKILHQSVIDVNESGTEASSATAVIAMRSTMITKDIPIVFKADRPFLFIVKQASSNVILFMGYLAEPPSIVAQEKASPSTQGQK
jgi:serpin B